MFDSYEADQPESCVGVSLVDACCEGVQRGAHGLVESFPGCGEALVLPLVPFGDKNDVVVAPAGKGGGVGDPCIRVVDLVGRASERPLLCPEMMAW